MLLRVGVVFFVMESTGCYLEEATSVRHFCEKWHLLQSARSLFLGSKKEDVNE